MRWRALQLPDAPERGTPQLLAEGHTALPALSPRASLDWQVAIAKQNLDLNQVLEVAVHDPGGEELWTWVLRADEASPTRTAPLMNPGVRRRGNVVEAGSYSLEFDPRTGMMIRLRRNGRDFPLRGPRLAAFLRAAETAFIQCAVPEPVLRKLELAPRRSPGVLARATFDGALREVTWRLVDDELVLSLCHRLPRHRRYSRCAIRLSGGTRRGQTLAGRGPYRIWKNRQAGTGFGLHAAQYSRAVPGESYDIPEFQGFFGAWRWLEIQTADGNVRHPQWRR